MGVNVYLEVGVPKCFHRRKEIHPLAAANISVVFAPWAYGLIYHPDFFFYFLRFIIRNDDSRANTQKSFIIIMNDTDSKDLYGCVVVCCRVPSRL